MNGRAAAKMDSQPAPLASYNQGGNG